MMPSILRSSEQNAMPARDRRRAGEATAPPAVDGNVAAVGAVGAEDQARRLGAAGAEQAGEADDLARVQLEIERLDRTAGDRARGRTGAAAARRSPVLLAAAALAATAVTSSRPSMARRARACGSSARCRHAPTERAVAQDGDAVADRVELVEEVGDEDDRRRRRRCSRRITSNSTATSRSSRVEVGSSRMTSLRARTSSARAIATICWTATE